MKFYWFFMQSTPLTAYYCCSNSATVCFTLLHPIFFYFSLHTSLGLFALFLSLVICFYFFLFRTFRYGFIKRWSHCNTLISCTVCIWLDYPFRYCEEGFCTLWIIPSSRGNGCSMKAIIGHRFDCTPFIYVHIWWYMKRMNKKKKKLFPCSSSSRLETISVMVSLQLRTISHWITHTHTHIILSFAISSVLFYFIPKIIEKTTQKTPSWRRRRRKKTI